MFRNKDYPNLTTMCTTSCNDVSYLSSDRQYVGLPTRQPLLDKITNAKSNVFISYEEIAQFDISPIGIGDELVTLYGRPLISTEGGMIWFYGCDYCGNRVAVFDSRGHCGKCSAEIRAEERIPDDNPTLA